MKLFVALFFTTAAHLMSAEILILPEEGVENCPEFADVDAGYFDVSNVEIIVESDTDIFLNGSVKIAKELKSPWVVEYFAEQFYRDKWTRSPIQRKFDDFCPFFHNPADLWYHLLEEFPGCPLKEGSEWKFNMVSLTDWPLVVPRSFVGKWRMNLHGYFEENGEKKIDCKRVHFEIAEV